MTWCLTLCFVSSFLKPSLLTRSQTAQTAESQIKASSPQSKVHLVPPPPLRSPHLSDPLYTLSPPLNFHRCSANLTLSRLILHPHFLKTGLLFLILSSLLLSTLPGSIRLHHCCLWIIMLQRLAITWKVNASFSDRRLPSSPRTSCSQAANHFCCWLV